MRYAENDNKVLCSLGKILTMEKPDDESLKFMSEFYSLDKESLRSDLKFPAHVKKQNFSCNCSIPSIFEHLVTCKAQMMMPKISKAMKMYSYYVNGLVVCFYVETSRGWETILCLRIVMFGPCKKRWLTPAMGHGGTLTWVTSRHDVETACVFIVKSRFLWVFIWI